MYSLLNESQEYTVYWEPKYLMKDWGGARTWTNEPSKALRLTKTEASIRAQEIGYGEAKYVGSHD